MAFLIVGPLCEAFSLTTERALGYMVAFTLITSSLLEPLSLVITLLSLANFHPPPAAALLYFCESGTRKCVAKQKQREEAFPW